MTKNIAALLSGIVFGLGLTISQMNNPDKVLAFLDISGNWDPSLAFVMAGALMTLSALQHFIFKREKPIYDSQFHLPNKNNGLDKSLILGAIIFGLGWGLIGFCPGAVLAALGDGKMEPFLFTLALAAGMMLFRLLQKEK